ncbi:MAG: hypothetical protein LBP31_02945 [Holosporales bacterium]|jgi:hypothetical protein|nr:hypothetical protein [Holosporales bacterium]
MKILRSVVCGVALTVALCGEYVSVYGQGGRNKGGANYLSTKGLARRTDVEGIRDLMVKYNNVNFVITTPQSGTNFGFEEKYIRDIMDALGRYTVALTDARDSINRLKVHKNSGWGQWYQNNIARYFVGLTGSGVMANFPPKELGSHPTLLDTLEYLTFNYGSLAWFFDCLFPHRNNEDSDDTASGVVLIGLPKRNNHGPNNKVEFVKVKIMLYGSRFNTIKKKYESIREHIGRLHIAREDVFTLMIRAGGMQEPLQNVLNAFYSYKRMHYPLAQNWNIGKLSEDLYDYDGNGDIDSYDYLSEDSDEDDYYGYEEEESNEFPV